MSAATAQQEEHGAAEERETFLGTMMKGVSTLFSPREPTPNAVNPVSPTDRLSGKSPKYAERLSRAKATNQSRMGSVASPNHLQRSFRNLFGLGNKGDAPSAAVPAQATPRKRSSILAMIGLAMDEEEPTADEAEAPAPAASNPRKKSSIAETVAAWWSDLTDSKAETQPKLRPSEGKQKFGALPAGLPPGM